MVSVDVNTMFTYSYWSLISLMVSVDVKHHVYVWRGSFHSVGKREFSHSRRCYRKRHKRAKVQAAAGTQLSCTGYKNSLTDYKAHLGIAYTKSATSNRK